MGVVTQDAKGYYGEILENSAIRGVFWMVIGDGSRIKQTVGGTNYDWRQLWAICIDDRSGYAQNQTGKVAMISDSGWIIHE